MSYYHSHLNQIYNGADPAQFATVGCLHRKLVGYRDRFGLLQSTPVDCGKCERCQDDRRNQWSARMWLHTIDSPWIYVYFVTLTYSPFDSSLYKEHPWLSDWNMSFPVKDRHNKFNQLKYTPSVLCLTHVQKYLKRLRKAAQDISPISFAYCGEYGESYARPHWHLVLYSQKPLPSSMIRDAWGFDTVIDPLHRDIVKRYRGDAFMSGNLKRSHFSIGRVDVVDLVSNGTMANSISSDPNFNAMHNFSYVAKYLGKPSKLLDDFIDYDDKFHTGILPSNANQVQILLERFTRVFGSLPLSQKEHPAQYDLAFPRPELKRDLPGCSSVSTSSNSLWDDPLHLMSDAPLWSPGVRSDVISLLDGLKPLNYRRDFNINNIVYENVNFEHFTALVSPCFHSSTRHCLGKCYGIKNLKRFASGNKELPKWRGKCLTFPRYFSYLMELEKCPVYFESASFSSRSFTHSNLGLVRKYFEMLSINPLSVSELSNDASLFRELQGRESFDFSGRSIAEINAVLRAYDMKDINHQARAVPSVKNYSEVVLRYPTRTLRACYNSRDDVFELFEYDFKSRARITEKLTDSNGVPLNPVGFYQAYHRVDVVPREEFCEYIIAVCDRCKSEYDASASARQAQLDLFSLIEESPDTQSARERWLSVRHRHNKDYSINHKDFN